MSDVPSAAPAAPAASSTPAPAAAKPAAPATGVSPAGSNAPASVPAAKANSGVPDAKLPHQDTEGGPTGNNHPEAKPGETKAETIQRMKLKLKVNGKEEEREFAPDELQLYVQKGLGADEKFRESAEVRKTFAALQKALKENPFEALKDPAFGLDLEKLAIDHLAKKFEAEDMKAKDPVNYELQELRKFKQDQEAARAAEAQRQQEAAAAEAQKLEIAQIKTAWTEALKRGGLDGNESMIRKVAEIAMDFNEQGLDLSPDVLVSEFKRRSSEENRMLFSGLKGESLANYLGDDVVNELLAFKVAQINATKAQEPLPTPEVPKTADENDEKPLRPERYLSGYRDFMRGD